VNAIQLSGQSDDALLDIIRVLFKVSQAVSPETCVYMSAADFAQVHERLQDHVRIRSLMQGQQRTETIAICGDIFFR
jgi:hypothetical protein